MLISPVFSLTFGMLALSVLLIWAPRIGVKRLAAWPFGLALACIAGLSFGYLDWRAPLSIAAFAGLSRRFPCAPTSTPRWQASS